MPTVALGLALVAALVHASWNTVLAGRGDQRAAIAVAGVCSVVIPLPLVLATWRAEPAVLGLAIPSAVLELMYLVLLGTAYDRAELSLVYPLARGLAPVLVLVLGVVVAGAPHSAAQSVGVVLVALGVLLVRGIRAGASAGDVALGLALATCIAGYTTIDKAGVAHASPLAYYLLVMGWPSIVYLGVTAATRGSAAVRAEIRPSTVLAGIGMFGAYALALVALGLAPAASVAAVRETSVVMATALAALVLHEGVGARRLLGSAVVAAGVAALALG